MTKWILSLFDGNDFTPHGFCVLWNPLLVWSGSTSDVVTALSYFSISIALVTFVRLRRDLAFSGTFVLFGAFIFLCGTTHLFGALTYWVPAYRMETLLKVATAAVSAITAILLWPLMPLALALPNASELRRLNEGLAHEVDRRTSVESDLRRLNAELEAQIAARDRTEQRFRLLVESVTDYAIFMLDPDGRVASWNRGAQRIKGYSADEILGHHFSEFYTPEDAAADKASTSLQMALENGRAEEEGWRVRKGGERFWAHATIVPVRARDGTLLGFGKVTRDLTELRRAQAELRSMNEDLERRVVERTASLTEMAQRLSKEVRERETKETMLQETTELLEATFDVAPFPIMVTNDEGKVLMWNRAGETVFGFTADEMRTQGYQFLVPPSGIPEAARIFDAARSDRVTAFAQVPRRDGKMLDIAVSTFPIFHDDRRLRAIVTVLEDLTQKNATEAQLRQSQKMEAIGVLTGGVAHDFNNLLGVIVGNLDLLRDEKPDDPLVKELASEALDAALRGAELTKRLLAFARRQPLQSRRIDLEELLTSTVKLLRRLLGDDIEIRSDLTARPCAVTIDPAQLEAALTNLATNARDAMPDGGLLTISTDHRTVDEGYIAANPDMKTGDYAVIEVTDTGCGIAPDVLGRIFEPFFSTKAERGTGLGLSMVFGFVKQSGGHISVYSELGVGTTLRLYLPCARTAEEVQADQRESSVPGARGEIVLLVEDNVALRRLVVRQLQDLGFQVVEAANGPEALKVLAERHVDIVLTDIAMPGGMSGLDLAAAIKRDWPKTAIVLTSGFPEARFRDREGLADVQLLSKPFRKDQLAQILRQELDRVGHSSATGSD